MGTVFLCVRRRRRRCRHPRFKLSRDRGHINISIYLPTYGISHRLNTLLPTIPYSSLLQFYLATAEWATDSSLCSLLACAPLKNDRVAENEDADSVNDGAKSYVCTREL